MLILPRHTWTVNRDMLELVSPGGLHFGTLPPAGLREAAGFDAETVVDGAGLMGADMTDGGVLTEMEIAVRQNYLYIKKKKGKSRRTETIAGSQKHT